MFSEHQGDLSSPCKQGKWSKNQCSNHLRWFLRFAVQQEWRGRGPRSVGKHVHRLTRMEILFLSTPPPLNRCLTGILTCKCNANTEPVTCKEGLQKKTAEIGRKEVQSSPPLINSNSPLKLQCSFISWVLTEMSVTPECWVTMCLNNCPLMEVYVHDRFVFGLRKGQGTKCLGMFKPTLLSSCTNKCLLVSCVA